MLEPKGPVSRGCLWQLHENGLACLGLCVGVERGTFKHKFMRCKLLMQR